VKDELKKQGLRIRPRVVESRAQKPSQPGQIAFDDRGNAIYEWREDYLTEDSAAGERARDKALAHPGLAIVEDEGPANSPIRNNTKGLRNGYNPYESGQLGKAEWKKKRNLKQLSEWIELKKKLGNKDE
jgi:hypothetical protein